MKKQNLIIDATILLCNQKGFANVKLSDIAQYLNISLGNLTYHFKTKEVLVEHILENQFSAQRKFYEGFRLMPLFEDFDVFLDQYFEFQQKYLFFFTDQLHILRNYSYIKEKDHELRKWEEQLLFSFFQFSAARGAFHSPKAFQSFSVLAKQISWILESWFMVQELRLNTNINVNDYKSEVWSVLQAYFTDNAWEEFNNLPKP